MALPSSPPISLLAIENEFGSNTIPSSPSLASMHNVIFGSGTKNQLDFLGYGKPEFTNPMTVSNVDDNGASFDAQMDTNNLSATYYFEWADNSSYIGSSSTTPASDMGTSVNMFHQENGLNSNTDYWVRCLIYNAFNDGAQADYVISEDTFTTDAGVSCASVDSISASAVNGSGFDVSWTDGANPNNGYELERRVNFGTWTLIASPAGSSRSYNDYQCSTDYNDTDTVQYRIRRDCGGGDGVSAYVSSSLYEAQC